MQTVYLSPENSRRLCEQGGAATIISAPDLESPTIGIP
jgi:hypothetical protein